MKSAFVKHFDGTIWKMDIHEPSKLLAIEWRTKEGIPNFSVIHYPSGILKLDKISYGDRWWTLAGITSTHLLLQHYADPGSAQTQALVAINLQENIIAWEQFNIQFQELVAEGLAIKSLTYGNNLSVLDEHTGKHILQAKSLSELTPIVRTVKSALPTNRVPLLSITDQTVVGPYFLLDEGEITYWGHHEQQKKTIRLMLTIVKNNQIDFKLCIEDKLDHLLPEVFFIIGNQLFFIRDNKREIVSYFV